MSWRLASVPYLNARPLIHGIQDRVTLCEPSRLADLLFHKQFDVGLVPIAEVLTHDQYDIVDGIAIASRGPIQSVFLAHRGPLEEITRVTVTAASRSSAWLVRVILKFGYGLTPEFLPRAGTGWLDEHAALVLIGDEALDFAARHPKQPRLDLGEAWTKLTGLPFVYAAWAVQRGTAEAALIELLRGAKVSGLAHLEEIVQNSGEATAEIRRNYLTRHVCFDLGKAEKAAIEQFQQYLQQLGLVKSVHGLRYVS